MSAPTTRHLNVVPTANAVTESEQSEMRGAVLTLEALEAPLGGSPATAALSAIIDNAMGHLPSDDHRDGCTICGVADGPGACRTWESALTMARYVRRLQE